MTEGRVLSIMSCEKPGEKGELGRAGRAGRTHSSGGFFFSPVPVVVVVEGSFLGYLPRHMLS